MTKKLTMILLVLLFGTVTAFAGAVNMKPGKWEITTKVEMPGMPMQMPPVTHSQCITKEDIVPQGAQHENDDCDIKNQKISGDTVTWEMECNEGAEKTTGKGTITYSGTTFKGSFDLKMPNGMVMKNIMSGKRIGTCSK